LAPPFFVAICLGRFNNNFTASFFAFLSGSDCNVATFWRAVSAADRAYGLKIELGVYSELAAR
jgi:hypothetical protein